MPYSPDNVEKLPKNVQAMDEKSRRQWCDIWNSVYAKHGDEGLAFREANGVLKKEGKSVNTENKEFDSLELADEYDPKDPASVAEFVGKQIGLDVEVKSINQHTEDFSDALVDFCKT